MTWGPTRRSPGGVSSSMTWGRGRQAGDEEETARCWEGEQEELLLQGWSRSTSRNMLLDRNMLLGWNMLKGWTELTGSLSDG